MKKFIRSFCLFFLCFFLNAKAFATTPCDPCAGQPWGPTMTTSYTFFLSQPAGCPFKAYVTYRTRPCMGKTQVEIVSYVIEDVNPVGSGCDLHCIHVPEVMKKMYIQVQGLIGGGPILRSLPSPCYYMGTITVPPGAEICYGMTPGSIKNVVVPCDPNGCCHSELVRVNTPTGPSYIQNVISSTPCPAVPLVPPSQTIEWACDILGGGTSSYTVAFTPDSPIVCRPICNPGPAKPGTTDIEEITHKTTITDLKIYPNPVDDYVRVSFNTENAGMTVQVDIFDISGKIAISKKITTSSSATQIIDINTSVLAKGVYALRMTYNGESVLTKITK